MNEISAILLAGGRGARMGGIDKPRLEVGGRTLLDAAIAAAGAVGAHPIVAVGPAARPSVAPTVSPAVEPAAVTWVREDPPFGGPVAAIIAALPHVTASRTLVLACDLPNVAVAVQLLCGAPFEGDGACLVDATGHSQWLIGLYRTDALRAAAADLPRGGEDASVKSLLAQLALTRVPASDHPGSASTFDDCTFDDDPTFDIDTWDDLTEARRVDAKRRDP
ncbi:molybdenum cofactor guanylyltransferase [uncultured Microbacterium sp.]|uniref:molybdenum cofactor guanylyltransferase n=1 Tax=uncultured Microbacterium sp. TaxID=191216 RepID=UPI0035CC0855